MTLTDEDWRALHPHLSSRVGSIHPSHHAEAHRTVVQRTSQHSVERQRGHHSGKNGNGERTEGEDDDDVI